jgi:hypothetical protein
MAVAWTQNTFRWRNDNGSETSATWLAAAGTNITPTIAYNETLKIRLRIVTQESGTTSSTLSGRLYIAKNGGSYSQISNSATNGCKVASSTNFTDDSVTTKQVTSGTFVAGRMDCSTGQCSATGTIAQNSYTEHEFELQFDGANLANGDYFDFRMRNGTTAYGTYTLTPRITFNRTAPPTGGTDVGITTIASNGYGYAADSPVAQKIVMTETGNVSFIKAYVNSSGSVSSKAYIYADNAGSPVGGTLKGVSNTVSLTNTAGWVQYDFTGITLSAGTYWIGVVSDTGTIYFYVAPSASYNTWDSAGTTYTGMFTSPPSTFPSQGASSQNDCSMYLEYTTGSGTKLISSRNSKGSVYDIQTTRLKGKSNCTIPASSLVDTFDVFDTSLWYDLSGGLEVNGQLNITNNAQNDLYGLWSNKTYDLTDSSIFIQLVNAGDQASGHLSIEVIELIDYNTNDDVCILVFNNLLYFGSTSVNGLLYSIAYNSSVHKWFKIRESSGTTYYDYSTDGINWLNLTSVANPINLSDLILRISVKNGYTNTSTAIFDNLNFIPGTARYLTSNLKSKSIGSDFQSSSRNSKAGSYDLQSSSRNSKAVSNDLQISSRNSKAVSNDLQSSSRNSKAVSNDLQSSSRNSKAVSNDLQSSSRNSKAVSNDLQISSRNSKAVSNDLQSSSRNSKAVSNDVLSVPINSKAVSNDLQSSSRNSKAVSNDLQSSSRNSKAVSNDLQSSSRNSKAVSNDVLVVNRNSKSISYDFQSSSRASKSSGNDLYASNVNSKSVAYLGVTSTVSVKSNCYSTDSLVVSRNIKASSYDVQGDVLNIKSNTNDTSNTVRSVKSISYDQSILSRNAKAVSYDQLNISRNVKAVSSDINISVLRSKTLSNDDILSTINIKSNTNDTSNSVRSVKSISYDLQSSSRNSKAVSYDQLNIFRNVKAVSSDINISVLRSKTLSNDDILSTINIKSYSYSDTKNTISCKAIGYSEDNVLNIKVSSSSYDLNISKVDLKSESYDESIISIRSKSSGNDLSIESINVKCEIYDTINNSIRCKSVCSDYNLNQNDIIYLKILENLEDISKEYPVFFDNVEANYESLPFVQVKHKPEPNVYNTIAESLCYKVSGSVFMTVTSESNSYLGPVYQVVNRLLNTFKTGKKFDKIVINKSYNNAGRYENNKYLIDVIVNYSYLKG